MIDDRRRARTVGLAMTLAVALAAAVGGCSTGPDVSSTAASEPQPTTRGTVPDDPRLATGLVTIDDLPDVAGGSWAPYEVDPSARPPTTRICGVIVDPDRPLAIGEASVGFAVDPEAGPIFGERIERYEPGGAAAVLEAYRRTADLPCEFDEDGTRWRSVDVPIVALGDESSAVLIESMTGPKGYTYQAVIRRGDDLVKYVLNDGEPDLDLLTELTQLVFERSAATPAP